MHYTRLHMGTRASPTKRQQLSDRSITDKLAYTYRYANTRGYSRVIFYIGELRLTPFAAAAMCVVPQLKALAPSDIHANETKMMAIQVNKHVGHTLQWWIFGSPTSPLWWEWGWARRKTKKKPTKLNRRANEVIERILIQICNSFVMALAHWLTLAWQSMHNIQ